MIKVADANRNFGNKVNMGAALPLSEFIESRNSVHHQNIDKMAKVMGEFFEDENNNNLSGIDKLGFFKSNPKEV